jgi:uncharacterized damage-inducible protein DinB
MFSIELIRDLYSHMEWADSLVWQATLGSPDAAADQKLRDRLSHIHMTQRAFLQVWSKQTLDRFQSLKFETTGELYAWIRPHYPEVRSFLATLRSAQFAEPTPVPWAKYFVQAGREAAVTTLGETLFQVTSHSTYHRGQVNTRLRELGAEPPLVDYIGWVWLGRPATSWPAP